MEKSRKKYKHACPIVKTFFFDRRNLPIFIESNGNTML
jgi:hypothetical protein